MDPTTQRALDASTRLRVYNMTIADLDITRPAIARRFVGVTKRDAVTMAADALRDVAGRLGVSPLALDYTLTEDAR